MSLSLIYIYIERERERDFETNALYKVWNSLIYNVLRHKIKGYVAKKKFP